MVNGMSGTTSRTRAPEHQDREVTAVLGHVTLSFSFAVIATAAGRSRAVNAAGARCNDRSRL